jgi:phosphoserine phosphatase SerB
LEFTKNAKMLCSSLKAMGCRLAILTGTGSRAIAEHVKQQLGIDYAICRDLSVENGCFTGEYAGIQDVRFRKLDLLKLMADREGIEYRNVLVVGDPFIGLQTATIRILQDTFGAFLYFNASEIKNLSVILYLLGFSGSHVRALQQRHGEDDKIELAQTSEREGCTKYLMDVSTKSQRPAHIVQLLSSLRADPSVTLDTVTQCSLQNGGMCCGLNISVKDTSAENLLKDVVFACQKHDMTVRITEHRAPGPKISMLNFQNRHVITMVQQPEINSRTLAGMFGGFAENGVNILKIDRLSLRRLTALQFSVVLPENLASETEFAKFSEKLGQLANEYGCDIALQTDDVERLMRRMIVFDMDSTLIQQEVIDELAKIAGVETQVKEITESAMRGEIDFFGSLKRRVALLKGHNSNALFSDVKKVIRFNPGAERLCSVLKKLGYKMAVISGGFLPVAEEVQRHLGLDYAFANTLEVDEQTGLLTGQTSGPVVTPSRKRALLATISDVEGCTIKQTIAVGDGANDIPMLHTAGLGIAFCAKPKVQAVSKYRINQRDLSTVLFLIGLSEHAIDRLAQSSEDDANGAALSEAKRRRVH